MPGRVKAELVDGVGWTLSCSCSYPSARYAAADEKWEIPATEDGLHQGAVPRYLLFCGLLMFP